MHLEILSPFFYSYMLNAMIISSVVGGLCAFLSAYLILKGWSLIGDALSHSIVPGVAGAYIIGLPFSIGAFFAGGIAAFAMLFLNKRTGLKEDVIIGLIFTSFFGLGLFMISLFPMAVDIQTIIMGNILTIAPKDTIQLLLIGVPSILILSLKWRDFMVTFFDENHAKTVGLNTERLKVLFFTILSLASVSGLQTVGAFLVIALLITPGATAYLLTDRFGVLISLSVIIGSSTCFLGTYLSFFLDGAVGGIIVIVQTVIFLSAFFVAPKHGYFTIRSRISRLLEKCND